MVDGISAKTLSGASGVARVATIAPVQTVRSMPRDAGLTTTDVAATGGLARTLAATPPVDTDRVALIKQAIADGQYPILPAKIADSLIAMRLQWMSDDQA